MVNEDIHSQGFHHKGVLDESVLNQIRLLHGLYEIVKQINTYLVVGQNARKEVVR